jgi:hypothetical protein
MDRSWSADGNLVGYAFLTLGSGALASLLLCFPKLADWLFHRNPWWYRVTPKWKRLNGYVMVIGALYFAIVLATHIVRCGGACYNSN